jgi:hypothetical protein
MPQPSNRPVTSSVAVSLPLFSPSPKCFWWLPPPPDLAFVPSSQSGTHCHWHCPSPATAAVLPPSICPRTGGTHRRPGLASNHFPWLSPPSVRLTPPAAPLHPADPGPESTPVPVPMLTSSGPSGP